MRARCQTAVFLALLGSIAAASETQYFALFIKGTRVGYLASTEDSAVFKTRRLRRSVMDMNFAADGVHASFHQLEYSEDDGHPVHIEYASIGPNENIRSVIDLQGEAFTWKETNKGKGSSGHGSVPEGATWSKGAFPRFREGDLREGESRAFTTFAVGSKSLTTETVVNKGPKNVAVNGNMVATTWYSDDEDGTKTDLYELADGSIVREDGFGGGIQLIPASKEAATAPPDANAAGLFVPLTDEVEGLGNPADLTDLKIEVTLDAKQGLPSDDHQTVTGINGGWIVHTHPVSSDGDPPCKSDKAASLQPEMVKSDPLLLSSDPKLVSLSHKLVGKIDEVYTAARAIQRYVAKTITYDLSAPNGRQRDALAILASGKGVCADYSVLAVALMRAAGIPARTVVGLASFEDDDRRFYPHAWISIFDGAQWVDLEPQGEDSQISAAYIELGFSVVDAKYLDMLPHLLGAKFKVIAAVHGNP